ncbi:MAG: helix-hairpin-helix domain-containing protein [Candidatus Omnitrophica bacterium]|nr:helix-hairpin-helix domain-containing protein [Candidatus Omnitrophota bacterium]MCF7894631.1 helix-hairpin-helix domain-containing protein [Candidatus Omnitrophota bacterium]
MFSLSPPEKKVVIIIACVIFLGTLIRFFNLEVNDTIVSHQPVSKQIQIIDINKADSNKLQEISGIGPVLSLQIIEYREARGPFKTIDDLKKVKGIGKKKAKIMKNYIKF